ncbi:hypothetical protein BG006_000674 [Podila minutissima]|uniref:Uncharacterized protein n=1 Tax=Podila minutissima TaxID=64525 RepID=A0A9P5SEQ3_9FUNG|nr:hypothetical protein BG006_000674 [Podila minutissima]
MDIYSFSSTFDSRPSARSSTSSIGNWAPRARSSSVSSQGSTGSVNLDAIIASESDLNEEKPLELVEGDEVELVEGDEVDWTSKEERPAVENAQPSIPTPLMANSYSTTTPRTTHLEDQGEDYWPGSISENEIDDDEDDEEFGEALREFSQMSLKTNSVQVRGLGFSSGLPSSSRISAPSSRFPQKKNHFDLDADYMDIPAGFDNLRSGSRTSTYSNSGTASNRSSISKMPTPSGLVQPKSGLKAPGASRLAQPGARSLVQPKSTGSRGTTPVSQAPKSGQAPKGLQAPRTGLQAPKTQAPRASTATRVPTKPGVALPPSRTGPSSLAKPQVKPGTRLIPPSAPASRVNTTRSQLAPPVNIKRPNIPTSTSNRTSLLQAPASLASRSTGTVGATVARMNAASAQSPNNPGLTSPKRSLTMPSGLSSPTRIRTGGSAMVSPTSSQTSTSSLPSLGYGARDSSQRLMNATGAASSTKSRLMGPRITTGRTSMYGSSAHLRMEDDYEEDTYYDDYRHPDYAVLTPPQSPSAKGSRLSMVLPTRLAIPTTMTTSRIGRPGSPAAMSVTGLRGTQVHGLVSPKAGHHRY